MSVLQNQDDWWGEGDDMFFIDGETRPPSTEPARKLFLGAWDFGTHAFSYGLFGAPVKGTNRAGARWSVYRFHLDSPIPFSKSLRPRSSMATQITVRMIIFRCLLVSTELTEQGRQSGKGGGSEDDEATKELLRVSKLLAARDSKTA